MSACPKCGQGNPPGARFCDGCGSQLADGPVIRVGRAADNDVVLDYPMISQHHARILGSGSDEDLGSTNGTRNLRS